MLLIVVLALQLLPPSVSTADLASRAFIRLLSNDTHVKYYQAKLTSAILRDRSRVFFFRQMVRDSDSMAAVVCIDRSIGPGGVVASILSL